MPKVKEPIPQYSTMQRTQSAELLLQEIQKLPEETIIEVMNYIRRLRVKKTKPKNKKFLTGKELAQSEIVGLWSSRSIPDSVEYVNQLRKQAEQRL
ncbi:MAG: DUF2281 domain-containing protein [Bacteroidota bacterium]